jgi:Protein of unknown function (DUF1570)
MRESSGVLKMPVVRNLTSVAVPRTDLSSERVGSWLAALLTFWFVLSLEPLAQAAGSTDRLAVLMRQYEEMYARFASDMEAVALECDQAQLADFAVEIRHQAQPLEQQPENIDNLPNQIQSDLPANLPLAERTARVRVRKLRTDYANELYLLARKAVTEKHPSFAYRLVREVLFHDPDHPNARKTRGYRRAGDEWTTQFTADKKKAGQVWHEEFGWLPAKHVERYEAGERFYNGKWITAAREETIRSDFKNPWEIETEHFYIRTNHSQQKGALLAASVEAFHCYFMREFAGFFQTPQQMDKLFQDGTGRKTVAPYRIDHFRLKSEFVAELANRCPVAAQINGIYMPSDRIAYFFHNPDTPDDDALGTLYHEVTHQLLSESTTQKIPVGHDRDFWVVEGIACYFESFRVAQDGTISVGDIQHPRIQAARDQVVTTQDQEPLERYLTYGMLPFQKGELAVLQNRYAQATGLAHFFLHSQNGLYRDGFIEYLSQVYSPDVRVRAGNKTRTLEQILGVPYATLDTQYAAYMRGIEGRTPE